MRFESVMWMHRVLKARGAKGEVEARVLFDTETSFTLVRKSLAEKIGHLVPTDVKEVTLVGKTKLTVSGSVPLSIEVDETSLEVQAYAVENLHEQLICGAKDIECNKINLNSANNKPSVDGKTPSFRKLLHHFDHIAPFFLIILCTASAAFLPTIPTLVIFLLTLTLYVLRRYDSRMFIGYAILLIIATASLLVAGREVRANQVATWSYYFLVLGVIALLIEYIRKEKAGSSDQNIV